MGNQELMEKILFTLQQLQKDQVDFRGEMNERLNRIERQPNHFRNALNSAPNSNPEATDRPQQQSRTARSSGRVHARRD